LYNPAYFGVIDMCRRFYFPIPFFDFIGELPNSETGRETNSALNATLGGQPTVVENYRNTGIPKKWLGIYGWKGFKLKGVAADHPIGNTYHGTILNAVRQQVVGNAIAAYKAVRP